MQSLSFIIKLVTRLFKQVAKFTLVLGVLLALVTTSPLVVQAQTNSDDSNRVLSSVFPACKFADTGLTSFLECASQITFFILVIAIIYVFLRLAYMATGSLVFAGGVTSDFYQMIRDSLRNLVVGIVFIGMPVAILTAIDPLAKVLSFRFLEEFNLGPEARLIEPSVKGKGCNDFHFCILSCKKNHRNSSECIIKCNRITQVASV